LQSRFAPCRVRVWAGYPNELRVHAASFGAQRWVGLLYSVKPNFVVHRLEPEAHHVSAVGVKARTPI